MNTRGACIYIYIFIYKYNILIYTFQLRISKAMYVELVYLSTISVSNLAVFQPKKNAIKKPSFRPARFSGVPIF